jgi:hypothetical protein
VLLEIARDLRHDARAHRESRHGESTGPRCDQSGPRRRHGGISRGAARPRASSAGRSGARRPSWAAASAGRSSRSSRSELPLRGIVASGGFYKTWLEHMLEIERAPACVRRTGAGAGDRRDARLCGFLRALPQRRPDARSGDRATSGPEAAVVRPARSSVRPGRRATTSRCRHSTSRVRGPT